MKNQASIGSVFVLITTLAICELAWAQGRSVNIILLDLQGKPVPGVRLAVRGSMSNVTDKNGRTNVPLSMQVEGNVQLELNIGNSSKRLVFISPSDGRIRVPSLE